MPAQSHSIGQISRVLQEGLALTAADPLGLLDGGGKPGGSAVPIEAAEGPGAVTLWPTDEALPPEVLLWCVAFAGALHRRCH